MASYLATYDASYEAADSLPPWAPLTTDAFTFASQPVATNLLQAQLSTYAGVLSFQGGPGWRFIPGLHAAHPLPHGTGSGCLTASVSTALVFGSIA